MLAPDSWPTAFGSPCCKVQSEAEKQNLLTGTEQGGTNVCNPHDKVLFTMGHMGLPCLTTSFIDKRGRGTLSVAGTATPPVWTFD